MTNARSVMKGDLCEKYEINQGIAFKEYIYVQRKSYGSF